MSIRERAARSLCYSDGYDPNSLRNGVPMWEIYLDEVDLVLRATVGEQVLSALKAADIVSN